MSDDSYVSDRKDPVIRHFSSDAALVHDGISEAHLDVTVKVRSGEYFGSLAMQLENLCSDPYMDFDTFKYILGKFSEDLLYLQDAYKIVKR